MLALNKEQSIAANYDGPEKHLLILAGAGTGKTRTLIGRVLHLVERGIPSKNILLLTFTRRAAGEIESRLKEEIGDKVSKLTAGTFHSFCLKIMRTVPEAFELKAMTVIDTDDAKALLSTLRGKYIEASGNSSMPKVGDIQSAISYSKNTCLDLKSYLTVYTELDDTTIDGFVEIAHNFEKAKKKRNYIDYDGILEKFADGVVNNKKLATKLSQVFTHILVDEFQDNNKLQYKILNGLSKSSLFLTGDAKQTIYSFRGSDFKGIHDFNNNTPDSKVLTLVENYRSVQPILDLANWLMKTSPIDYSEDLIAARSDGVKPIFLDFNFRMEEACWVANDIARKSESGQALKNIMVLVRTAMSANH